MGFDELTRISAIYFWDNSGTKITSQYFDEVISKENRSMFEDTVWKLASIDLSAQVLQHEDKIVVFRTIEDFSLFAIGTINCNELLMDEVLETLSVALGLIFRGKAKTEILVKQIDLLYLLIDETIGHGYVFEGNPEVVAARVMLKDDAAFAGRANKDTSSF